MTFADIRNAYNDNGPTSAAAVVVPNPRTPVDVSGLRRGRTGTRRPALPGPGSAQQEVHRPAHHLVPRAGRRNALEPEAHVQGVRRRDDGTFGEAGRSRPRPVVGV